MKKVFFFIITIILGLMLLTVSYQGFYMGNIQGMIESSLKDKNYDELARSFLPFFNKEEYNLGTINTDKGSASLIGYEAIVGEETVVKYEDKEVTTNRYQEAFVIFVDEINFSLNGKKEDDKVNNYTSLKVYNNDRSYTYYFNDPIDAAGPDAENVNRFYTAAAEELKFVEVNLDLDTIKEEIGDNITKVEVYNSHNELVGSVDCNIDFVSDFYDLTGAIVESYDEYLKNPSDEEASNKYQEFYQSWYENYSKNENFGIAYTQKDLKPAKIYWYTAALMLVYIAICSVLGFYILRKKPTLVEQVKSSKLNTYRTFDKRTNVVTEEDILLDNEKLKERKKQEQEKSTDVIDSNTLDVKEENIINKEEVSTDTSNESNNIDNE